MINQRTNTGGAVDGLDSWSQSGILVAGEFLAPGQSGPGVTGWILQPPKHIVSLQFSPQDIAARVRTIQFGITPAMGQVEPGTAIQPSGTPPQGGPIVDQNGNITPAAVTNGSPTVLFPPISASTVIAGAPQVLPVANDYLSFAGDPTRIYQVLSSVAPSTVTLTQPYKGTSTLRTSVSRLAQVAITPPAGPAALTPRAIDCVALISWVVQGNRVNRIVSVNNGVSISAPAEAVNIVVLDNTYNINSAGGAPTGSAPGYQYIVTVTVTTGIRASILPPTLTMNFPPLSQVTTTLPTTTIYQPFLKFPVTHGGGTATIPVPPNAGISGFYISAYDTTNQQTPPILNVIQEDTSGGNLAQTFLGPPDPGQLIPLYPDTTQLLFKNSAASDDLFVTVLWALDG